MERYIGPYWETQLSHKCGHYFPHAIPVNRDKKVIINCEFCGEYKDPKINNCPLVDAENVDEYRKKQLEGILSAPYSIKSVIRK